MFQIAEERNMKIRVGQSGASLVRGAVGTFLVAGSFVGMSFGHVSAQETAPSIEILSPVAGTPVTTDDVEVKLKISNFTIDCTKVGRPDEEGVGHVHVMLDGMTMATLTNFYCSDTFTIPGDGLTAGPHKLIVDLSSNTHMDMMETAQEVEFDYQPANVIALPAANDLGEPGVELVTPLDGATVPSTFTIEVKAVNFVPTEVFEGKGNIPGYGHYHVFVDTPMGMMDMEMMGTPEEGDMSMMASPEAGMDDHMAMMSMAGMVLMPGADTFTLDLSAWGPGAHTIWIEPVQNDHTMFETFGHIEFTVIIEE